MRTRLGSARTNGGDGIGSAMINDQSGTTQSRRPSEKATSDHLRVPMALSELGSQSDRPCASVCVALRASNLSAPSLRLNVTRDMRATDNLYDFTTICKSLELQLYAIANLRGE